MTARVPFLDLKAAYGELQEALETAALTSLQSGWYIGGDDVTAFETAFATYTGAGHCVGVANGLDAITLALKALGIGPGDDVLVPSNTYIATWLAVVQVGARPVPVEPDPATHTITAEGMADVITPSTRAVIAVHLYGCPAPIDEIVTRARSKGLSVIEDAAQAHGARWKDQRIGGHGDVITWSFYPGKNLGAMGDGGAVTTHDAQLAETLRMLGNYGSKQRYVHDLQGTNSRLDPVQAAMLTVKLGHLDAWNDRRRAHAARYNAAFRDSALTLPAPPEDADPVWHLYVVRTPRRDALQAHLAARGIETLIHYPCPPHKQGAFRDMGLHLPVAETLADEVLSLPIGPHLSADQQARVIEAVLDFAA
ncbi:MAG: DegT/DnrJ/EryC1/StrS family aminotransferase [Pseudomonadota bacterium]